MAIEMKRLDSDKETDGKLRWIADVDGAPFELYIPKWRVPSPWPGKIRVKIEFGTCDPSTKPAITKSEVARDPSLTTRLIVTVLRPYDTLTKTIRFRSTVERKFWEIGEPYIPISILPKGTISDIRLTVDWELSSRGTF